MDKISALLIPLIQRFMNQTTVTIREDIKQCILNAYQQAKLTTNPIDELFITLIAGLLGIEV